MPDRVYSVSLAGGAVTCTLASQADAVPGRLLMAVAATATAIEIQDVLGILAADINACPADYSGDRNRIYSVSIHAAALPPFPFTPQHLKPRGPFIRLDDSLGPVALGRPRFATHVGADIGAAQFLVPFAATAEEVVTAVATMRADAIANPSKYGS